MLSRAALLACPTCRCGGRRPLPCSIGTWQRSAHLPDGLDRPRGPAPLRAARRDRHRRIDSSHRGVDPLQEARDRSLRRGLRRQDRQRSLHGGPEGRRAAREGSRRDDSGDGPQGLGLLDGDGSPARRSRGERERSRGIDPHARRRRAGRPAREHASPRRGPRARGGPRDEHEGSPSPPQRRPCRRPGAGDFPRSSSRLRAATRVSATIRSGSLSPSRGATSRRPPPA